MNKTLEYLKEVRVELKNVTWPTKNQTLFFTIAVLIVSVFVAYFLGFFDTLFSTGLEKFLSR